MKRKTINAFNEYYKSCKAVLEDKDMSESVKQITTIAFYVTSVLILNTLIKEKIIK